MAVELGRCNNENVNSFSPIPYAPCHMSLKYTVNRQLIFSGSPSYGHPSSTGVGVVFGVGKGWFKISPYWRCTTSHLSPVTYSHAAFQFEDSDSDRFDLRLL